MRNGILIAFLTTVAPSAQATECGDARTAYAHFKTGATVEQDQHHAGPAHDARTQLEAAEKKMHSACVPHRVGITALPLGYVSGAPGNASKSTVDPPESWKLSLTTRAGAANGIVFAEPAAIDLPGGQHWEVGAAAKGPGEISLAIAVDAQLTVEEPTAGKGEWKIELKKPPQLVALSAVQSCAGGKGDAGAKLDKATCQMLLRAAPILKDSALPERGRAVRLGEWQYGWHAALELGELELSDQAVDPTPARVDLPLVLSAPIPGVSDGKRLDVTVDGAGLDKPNGAAFKLGHDCGADDDACEKQHFAVEVWFDRAFGVPFLRVPPSVIAGRATGKVADRLARPMIGQRVMLIEGARKVITITDDLGEYHYSSLQSGEALVFPVGRKPVDRPGKEESKKAMIGTSETKLPILYVNKLFE